ncbi:hypothetical protein HGM15179_016947, partial [Zosterops borbonicus]
IPPQELQPQEGVGGSKEKLKVWTTLSPKMRWEVVAVLSLWVWEGRASAARVPKLCPENPLEQIPTAAELTQIPVWKRLELLWILGMFLDQGKAPGRAQSPRQGLERGWGQGMEGQDTGNGFKLGKGRFKWDIGKEFLAGMEFPDLLWLPLDPWQCPRPGWDNLGQWEVSLPMAGVALDGI